MNSLEKFNTDKLTFVERLVAILYDPIDRAKAALFIEDLAMHEAGHTLVALNEGVDISEVTSIRSATRFLAAIFFSRPIDTYGVMRTSRQRMDPNTYLKVALGGIAADTLERRSLKMTEKYIIHEILARSKLSDYHDLSKAMKVIEEFFRKHHTHEVNDLAVCMIIMICIDELAQIFHEPDVKKMLSIIQGLILDDKLFYLVESRIAIELTLAGFNEDKIDSVKRRIKKIDHTYWIRNPDKIVERYNKIRF